MWVVYTSFKGWRRGLFSPHCPFRNYSTFWLHVRKDDRSSVQLKEKEKYPKFSVNRKKLGHLSWRKLDINSPLPCISCRTLEQSCNWNNLCPHLWNRGNTTYFPEVGWDSIGGFRSCQWTFSNCLSAPSLRFPNSVAIWYRFLMENFTPWGIYSLRYFTWWVDMDNITRRTWPFPFLHSFMEDDRLCSCVLLFAEESKGRACVRLSCPEGTLWGAGVWSLSRLARIVSPQIYIYPESVKVTLFVNWVFPDVFKLRWGHIALGWEPIQQLASLQAENLDTDTHGGRCQVMTEPEKGTGCRRTGDAEDC